MKNNNIKKVKVSDKILAESNLYPSLYLARVCSQYRDLYKVMYEYNELMAEVSGKFHFEIKRLSDYPAVGDYVMIDRNTNSNGNAIIHHVLSRKSAFIRKATGTSNDSQIIASNIDTVFICMSLNNDFNLRRLERYLVIAWDSGAVPVIVLTKSDLCEDIYQKLTDVNSVAIGVDVLVTSSICEEGYMQILGYIREGQTIAFIGSSGVGKSTLINCLIGENIIKTDELRNDDKGRHTTTRRELIMLENGAMVIDTPGMREMGLECVDLSKTFSDIDELATKCKYHDCSHKSEPGCAVQKAINEGVISAERFHSYQKLKKESGYEGLTSRQIEAVKTNEMFKEVGGIKNARKLAKSKNIR